MRNLTIVYIFIFSSFCNYSIAQDDCSCEEIQVVNICFVPSASICGTNTFNCGITLDHPLQQDGIVPKLLSLDNFGPQGVTECSMNLIPISGINNVEDITSRDCHIFYVGNFPKDAADFTDTDLPDQTLQAIYQWSVLCSKNLAIVPQAEALRWGYQIVNQNVNPNQPLPNNDPFFDVFDGPFGTVNSFDQGGSFQGVIVTFPPTGMTPLAIDNNNKWTISLDHATSDLIIGDIGYFSSNGPGNISTGPNLINDNDRLACNIFALGSEIVNTDHFIFEDFEICDGGEVTSYGGNIITQGGVFIDTIFSVIGCDTIVNTQVALNNELVITQSDLELCHDETYMLNGTNYQIGDIDSTEFLTIGNCDGLHITRFIPFPDVSLAEITDTICINATNPSIDLNLLGTTNIEWSPQVGLSCYECITPVYDLDLAIPVYDLFIEDVNGCIFEDKVHIIAIREPYIPNAFSPNKDGVNDVFTIFFDSQSLTKQIIIEDFVLYDRWGNLIKSISDQLVGPNLEMWDGRFKEKVVSPGVYFYNLTIQLPDLSILNYQGEITLIN